MLEIQLIRPTPEGVRYIAETMREDDKAEILLASGESPIEALEAGVEMSDYIAMAVINGTPCSIFGLVVKNLLCGSGVPWLLSSEAVLSHKRQFLLQSQSVLSSMLDVCSELMNYVHVDNGFSIRWLQRIGFTLEDPEPYGVSGALFHKFYMRADNVHPDTRFNTGTAVV